jgi:hypothetical protein
MKKLIVKLLLKNILKKKVKNLIGKKIKIVIIKMMTQLQNNCFHFQMIKIILKFRIILVKKVHL